MQNGLAFSMPTGLDSQCLQAALLYFTICEELNSPEALLLPISFLGT